MIEMPDVEALAQPRHHRIASKLLNDQADDLVLHDDKSVVKGYWTPGEIAGDERGDDGFTFLLSNVRYLSREVIGCNSA